jgi:RNA polymerase sigma-70 factor (ECF subfamily)
MTPTPQGDLARFFAAAPTPLSAAAKAEIAASVTAARAAIAELWSAPAEIDAFFLRLAGELADAADVDELQRRHLVDLYVADRCAHGDAAAIAWVERTCVAPLGPAIGRIDSSPVFVDEIRQRVRTKLLVAIGARPPRIAEYAGRGPLGAWVRVVAVREALAARRQRGHEAPRGDALLDVGASVTSPELGLVKEQYRVEFEEAFRAALAELTAEQRNLLRHHYLHGLTLDQIAGLYGMHRSSVARRIAKTRSGLLSATRRGLMSRLATSQVEFDELMALIASRIDLSIERHLAVSAAPAS